MSMLTMSTDYGLRYVNVSEADARIIAGKILNKMQNDHDLMTAGRRNDDSVNLMICCKICNIEPDGWLLNTWKMPGGIYGLLRYRAFYNDHKDRIEPYIDKWFSEDPDLLGLQYLVHADYHTEVYTEWYDKQFEKEEE